MIQAIYSKKKYPEYATHGKLTQFYFIDEASQHTHTQTQRKEKWDFPSASSWQARSFGAYRGKMAHAPSRPHARLVGSPPRNPFFHNSPSKSPTSRTTLSNNSSNNPSEHSSNNPSEPLLEQPLRTTPRTTGFHTHSPFRVAPASFFCPTPLLGVPSLLRPIGPADTPPARQRDRGAWHGAREIIPPKRDPQLFSPLTPGSDRTSPTTSAGK